MIPHGHETGTKLTAGGKPIGQHLWFNGHVSEACLSMNSLKRGEKSPVHRKTLHWHYALSGAICS